MSFLSRRSVGFIRVFLELFPSLPEFCTPNHGLVLNAPTLFEQTRLCLWRFVLYTVFILESLAACVGLQKRLI